jgi:predicted transposase/invertase (TIGR01784 family)
LKIFLLRYIVSTKEVKKDKLLKTIEEKYIGGDYIIPTLAREWFDEEKQIGLMERREEGREEGINLGMEQGKTELILRMFNKGYSVDKISDITDLSKTAIEEILKKQ